MQNSLLQQGIDLMLFGMGTVFVFLTLLVISVGLMSKLITRFFAEPEPVLDIEPPVAKKPQAMQVEPRILSVIQDAIHQHRAKNQP